MSELKKYDIDIFGLANKEYVYDYESGDEFFGEMQQELIRHGHFTAQVRLEKSATMIQLNFDISGTVELSCDRSLELFQEPFHVRQPFFLKFGDRNEELTEEIEIINRQTIRINIARYIYDFIVLALPVKRLHPRFREENHSEEYTLIYSSGAATAAQAETDPRWESLKKIK